MALIALLGATCLELAGWRMSADRDVPGSAYVDVEVTAHQPGSASVAIAGDTMFGDGSGELIASAGLSAVLAGVAGMLSDADAAVVNLEAPITMIAEPFDPGSQYSYASPPDAAAALAAIGVDVLQVGNNHVMDRGPGGLADTAAAAADAGLVLVGAGADRAEAARPVLLRSDGLTVALVSFGEDYGRDKRAARSAAGMVPFSIAAVRQAERTARGAGADRVIALVHWGDNYADVDSVQRYWAGQLADAGYDAVIGTGPHILQTVELVGGIPVAYSIGNFVFGSPGRFSADGRPGLGAVATVSFDESGGTLSLRCLSVDNDVVGYVPRECDAAESAAAAAEIEGGLSWQGSTGTVRF